MAHLEGAAQLSTDHGRPDLVDRLAETRRALAERDLPVVVVGEFKQGKSTLINALVRTTACPVDEDIVTAVPTVVRFGSPAGAFVHYLPEDDDSTARTEAVALDELPRYVCESGDLTQPGVQSVEVHLDRRLLQSGLSLVDTPGVGGLDSAHGNLTLGLLSGARAALFVTDASQELTLPELTYLQAARARARVLCVVTKIDLYPAWREVVELDARRLATAGLDVEILPVSSFLRMRAASTGSTGLNEESGFPALLQFLHNEVRTGEEAAAAAAASEVAFATNLLEKRLEAERAVVSSPTEAPAVIESLKRANASAQRLQGASAPWQQVLGDGIQDLVADVEHDLQERIRVIARTADGIIDQGDPADTWPQFEAWLRTQVAAEAVANVEYLSERSTDLARRVGDLFRSAAPDDVELEPASITAALDQLRNVGEVETGRGGRSTNMLSAARGSYGGMAMFGMAGSMLPTGAAALSLPLVGLTVGALVLPLTLVVGVGLGRRAVREERERQLLARRHQAKARCRQYLDQTTFVVGKACRDSLRRTQRQLRDEFSTRAASIQRSSAEALASAEGARSLSEDDRIEREAELREALKPIAAIGDRATAMAGTGGGAGGRDTAR